MSSFLSNKTIPGQSATGNRGTEVWVYLTFAPLWQSTVYGHMIPLLSKTRTQTLSLNIGSFVGTFYI